MREFFIRSLEALLNIVVVIAAIGIIIAAGAVTFGGGGLGEGMGPMGHMGGGPLAGLLILVGGGIYLILFGGLMYLGLGIYQNTKRSADALERMADKG